MTKLSEVTFIAGTSGTDKVDKSYMVYLVKNGKIWIPRDQDNAGYGNTVQEAMKDAKRIAREVCNEE
jgi:hypothetical protein